MQGCLRFQFYYSYFIYFTVIQIHILYAAWCCQDRHEDLQNNLAARLSRHWLSACEVGTLRGPCRPFRCVPIRCNTCQSSVCDMVRNIRSLALHDSPCILPASKPAFFRASSRSCSSFMQYSVRRLYSFCKALKSSRNCLGL